jgi:predicted ABC-type ATPase
MLKNVDLDRRPIIVVVAGSNGAGKSTFYESHLKWTGLRFINADVIARELRTDADSAALQADAFRRDLVARNESFIFETVFSDPVKAKIAFLEEAISYGYCIVVCFVGLSNHEISVERVAMRVSQGGHDVPEEKLRSRFPRTLNNLEFAIRRLPDVLIYDNSDLSLPYREIIQFSHGQILIESGPIPDWLRPHLPDAPRNESE